MIAVARSTFLIEQLLHSLPIMDGADLPNGKRTTWFSAIRQYIRCALNWRFSKMSQRAGIGHWHAHEGCHTAVSIMSQHGVPIQEISDSVGHKSIHVTETVYRHVIAPSIRGGATVMDSVFGSDEDVAWSLG